ncbi:hypothetical protein GPA10_24220 [Streptomyces sp. p1417]|uniref:Deoxyribonuclease NucA/NucB domain-containing protein n=1 Tax=Streptomyces typhae TaxID=2681492 RepID=A0A6L6X1Y4_9ACTN|nr:hypothetical protein [Streptomyces typhae]
MAPSGIHCRDPVRGLNGASSIAAHRSSPKILRERLHRGRKKECDEFPFASTYQGAAEWRHSQQTDRYNFSVKALPKESNGAAGTLLRDYYDKNRLIDGPDDGFLMRTTS